MTTRDKGWRNLQRKRKTINERSDKKSQFKEEKNWKLLYTSAVKLHRAKKLGKEYPIKSTQQILEKNE